MVKDNRKSRKQLKLKKLSEKVPISKAQQYREQELELFVQEDIKEEQENHIPKKSIQVSEQKWMDEHDEHVSVDLSKVARLRKLIKKDGETIVSGVEYQKRLREFYKSKSNLGWAQKGQKIETEENQETLEQLLSQNVENRTFRSDILKLSILDIDFIAQSDDKSKGKSVVQSMSFHPKLSLFVTGGFDKTLRVYQAHEKGIQLKKTIVLEKFPINKVQFMGQSVIVSSPFNTFLLSVDVITNQSVQFRTTLFTKHFTAQGRYNKQIEFSADEKHIAIFNDSGYIHIMDSITKTFQFELKMNEKCLTAEFCNGYLLSGGPSGKIYQWDLINRRIHNVFANPGGSHITSMSYREGYLAIGGKTGIINIYKINLVDDSYQHIKEIQNLTTQVDTLVFNPSAELLVAASKWKDGAARILHVDSMTVFQNWPTPKTYLKKVNCVAISNDSRFLVIGNEDGHVKAFRLQHY